MRNKTKKIIAGILLAVTTVISTVGVNVTEVEAKTARCKEACCLAHYNDVVYNGKTKSLSVCKGYETVFIQVFDEKHSVQFTSSNTSVLSLYKKSGRDAKFKVKKCGTAVITAKSSCGNKFKVKVTVTDHKYEEEEYAYGYGLVKKCDYCHDQVYIKKVSYKVPKNYNPTEEEIYQKMLDAVGPDREIIGCYEIPEYHKSWNCEAWTNWILLKTWGIGYKDRGNVYEYAKPVTDYSKLRCGDVVFMPNHVAVVVKNLDNERVMLTSYGAGVFYLGFSDEEYNRWYKDEDPDTSIGLRIIPYRRLDEAYTYYRN